MNNNVVSRLQNNICDFVATPTVKLSLSNQKLNFTVLVLVLIRCDELLKPIASIFAKVQSAR